MSMQCSLPDNGASLKCQEIPLICMISPVR